MNDDSKLQKALPLYTGVWRLFVRNRRTKVSNQHETQATEYESSVQIIVVDMHYHAKLRAIL